MKDGFSRRDFLLVGGATVAGITLGQAGRHLLARGDERLQPSRGPGVERWAATVCRECPAACGLRVRVVDGVPVKLEGNASCPIGRGRLCAKGQAAIEGYFDPDRLVGPARRTGKRGEHRWEPITWDAAIALLASHLTARNDSDVARPVAFAAEEHGALAKAWTGFWEAAGGQCAWTLAATPARLRPTFAGLTGLDRDPIFDLEHATHVLSFGAPIAEDWLSPVWTQRSYGRFRRGPSATRGRLVHVEVRRSMTARKADDWISVPPEQQTTLALGIASVILRENRANRELLETFGGSFQQFEKDVVEIYPPDEVAAATGVPVVTLLRLARELAASARPVAVCGADASQALASSVLALNALVGAFDRQGGVFVSPAPAVEPYRDATQVLRDIATGTRRPRLVAFRDASTLRALGAPPAPASGLDNAAFVVSFSPYLDEAAEVADLLLPSPTPLESWHAVAPPAVAGADCVAVAGPAVSSRLDTRDCLAVLGAGATRVGGELARAAKVTGSAPVVDAEIDRLFAARRGGPYSNVHEGAWLRELETGGWWVPPAATREAFAGLVFDAGGWHDPYFEAGAIRAAVRARGGMSWPSARLPVASQAAAVRPPTRSVPLAPDEEFPLRLMVFTPPVVGLIAGANHPVLFELLGQPEGQAWRVWAEMGPETAREFAVSDGSDIRITSQHGGSIDAIAIVVDGMARGTVAVAYVPASAGGGRWARLLQADVRVLFGRDGAASPSPVRVAAI
jgi:anaerobic selenocysteine-containing dehydrogenase